MSNLGGLFALFLLCLFLAKTSAMVVYTSEQKHCAIQLLAEESEDQEENKDTDIQDVNEEYTSDSQSYNLIKSIPIVNSHLIAVYRLNAYPSEYLEKALRPPCF